ncbi:hypothetical protein [Algoriphagus limi]|uniref:Uncharacterized protein n=1 Tax=Algoriphagus limi TaxID=2975273 RepID=A0ABT2G6C5_9BACT|nr:hypothetical protein [Algoriphagus limi]MCS5490817.1 hypothetical protein [Algoriphagus limi]
MIEKFLARIEDNYYFHMVAICGFLSLLFFLLLDKKKRRDHYILVPFLLVMLVNFYEVMATFMVVNKPINEIFHRLLTDEPFLGWNAWVYNIFYYQVSKLGLLLLIGINLKKALSKKIVLILGIVFLLYCIYPYFSKTYPIHGIQQPILYFLGNTILIIASGLFFMDLITEEYFIEINPLAYLPFWYITIIMFHSVIVFMADVAIEYLTFENTRVYYMFNLVSRVLYVILLSVFTFLIFTGKNFISRTVHT